MCIDSFDLHQKNSFLKTSPHLNFFRPPPLLEGVVVVVLGAAVSGGRLWGRAALRRISWRVTSASLGMWMARQVGRGLFS